MAGSNDADRVYGEVRRAIVEGRYAPGVRLVEQRVAEELDVSRTPVRETVRRLEAEGLVVVEPNRGAQVRSLSQAEISDLYELRARLEAFGAELAATRRADADVTQLRGAAEAFAAAADVGPLEVRAIRRLDSSNADFHDTLLRMSAHERLRQMVRRAVDAPLVFQALRRFEEAELDRSATFHFLIADAVESMAPERAGRLMTEHVLLGRDAILRRIQEAGDIETLFEGIGDP